MLKEFSVRTKILLALFLTLLSLNFLMYYGHQSVQKRTQKDEEKGQEALYRLTRLLSLLDELEVIEIHLKNSHGSADWSRYKKVLEETLSEKKALFLADTRIPENRVLSEVQREIELRQRVMSQRILTDKEGSHPDLFLLLDSQNLWSLRDQSKDLLGTYRDHSIELRMKNTESLGWLRYSSWGLVVLDLLIFLWVFIVLRSEKKTLQGHICRLQELEEQFRTILQNAPVIFWVIDRDEKFTLFDGKALELAGFKSREVVGSLYSDVFTDPKSNHPLYRAFAGEVVKQDLVIRERWYESVFMPVKSHNRVQGVMGISLDITDRKMREQSARQGNEAKSRFLANMTHEIRHPIGIISGFIDLALSSDVKDDERMDLLVKVKKNSEVLIELVNDILDLSKVEAGKIEIESRDLNLMEFLCEINETYEFKCHEKRLDYIQQINSPLPLHVRTDTTRLRQVLSNLLSNSLKFTEQGFIRLSTEAHAISMDSAELRFFVQDSGIGVTEEQAERLFKPFSQADSSTTRKFGGTGLGLALSKKIAQSLNGDLRLISSEPQSGSVFSLTMICQVVGDEKFKILTPAAKKEPSRLLSPRESSLAGLHVLLVEDSIDNQYLVEKMLRAEGAEVTTVDDGKKGVEAALRNNFDVVLMDIQMPVMDGFQATETLRREGYTKKIVALTANALKEEMEQAFQIGFDEYLTKPINKSHLVETLSEIKLSFHQQSFA